MTEITHPKSIRPDKPHIWREFYGIFIFYIKIFIAILIFGSLFFFVYAGIKTGNIPIDVVAIFFSGALTVITSIVCAVALYDAKVKAFRSASKEIEKTKLEITRMKDEFKNLHTIEAELNKLAIEFQQTSKINKRVKMINDIEFRMARSLVNSTESSVILKMLAKTAFTSIFSGILSTNKEKRERVVL